MSMADPRRTSSSTTRGGRAATHTPTAPATPRPHALAPANAAAEAASIWSPISSTNTLTNDVYQVCVTQSQWKETCGGTLAHNKMSSEYNTTAITYAQYCPQLAAHDPTKCAAAELVGSMARNVKWTRKMDGATAINGQPLVRP